MQVHCPNGMPIICNCDMTTPGIMRLLRPTRTGDSSYSDTCRVCKTVYVSPKAVTLTIQEYKKGGQP